MIYVGTAGWSYPQGDGRWEGVFYPRDKKVDRLGYYAERFDAVEINSSFYRPPDARITRSWAAKTPARFRFTAKLYQKFTHPKMYEAATGDAAELRAADFEQYRTGIDPLAAAGKLGALLAQFPPSFKADDETLTVLEDVLRQFREYPLAVELRHRSWSDDARVAALLREHQVAWCVIDEPKFRTSIGEIPRTARLGYLRFHGRNAAQWWRGDRETRYDYLYGAAEQAALTAEVREVADQALDTYVFYNNHFRAKAIANAVQLKAALGQPLALPLEPSMLAEYPELKNLLPASAPGTATSADNERGASVG